MQNIIDQLLEMEDESVIPADIENKINKVLSITKTHQFTEMNLTEDECNALLLSVEELEKDIKNSDEVTRRVKKAKPEFLIVRQTNENFI